LGALALTTTSCYNADKDFPDYEGGTKAYFAYQNPIRTLVLGNDIYDNSLDNAHKCRIWATMGGAYAGRNAVVSVEIDESLCNNLYFLDDGGYERAKVLPLPHNYYNYDAVKNATINYNGDSRGYLEIEFTDDFFNDPKTSSADTTYVIPVRMTGVTGIDALLSGTPNKANPIRQNANDWSILPKDYTLYCVRYMNPWQGKYIRRGTDEVTEAEDGSVWTHIRKDTTLIKSDPGRYPINLVNQNDEVVGMTTINMNKTLFPITVERSLTAKGKARQSLPCNLILTFNGDNCTISTNDANVEVSGTGKFIAKGTELDQYKEFQWGNLNGQLVQRDILDLAYTIKFKKGMVIGYDQDKEEDILLAEDVDVKSTDILVVQTRESNKREWFDYKYNDQYAGN
jgi:hypothetical protein